jgi:UDP-glucose 4-epimerase
MIEGQIAIVGGSGYVGSTLARYLDDTFEIRILDMKPVSKDLESRVSFRKCDIRNCDSLKENLKAVDLVINTAIVQIPVINDKKKLGYEVNVVGTQNLCEAVLESSSIRGLLLVGSWHVFGEKEFKGIVNEEYGFRPDKVEERAKFYALTKVAQETIVRTCDEFSEKIFGVIRIGTVLGEEMSKKTAAGAFITEGIEGRRITPFKHSMYRPMLYVDVYDVCQGFKGFAQKIIRGEIDNKLDSLAHVVNLMWSKSITIVDLATIVRNTIIEQTQGKITPEIEIIDQKKPVIYSKEKVITVDCQRAQSLLGINKLTTPQESIARIIRRRLVSQNEHV